MRILQIAPPWFTVPPQGYGGTEQVVALLTEGLVEAGHDVTLVASRGSVTSARLRTVFEDPPAALIGSAEPDLVHCLHALRDADSFDVVHDHTGLIGAALLSVAAGPPAVHTLHGDWPPAAAAVYAALSPSVRLVAISDAQRRAAPAEVCITEVVHNGIDVDAFPFAPRPRDGSSHLAFVGRSCRDKAPEIAVEVARRLRRPLRMAVKINEESERRHWDTAVAPLLDDADVDVDVVVNGDRRAAIEVMRGADATVVPIRWAEPFGLVMVESAACGTPVVAFASGAAPEVVAHGRSGFLVPPDDVDALCDAVDEATRLDPVECRLWVDAHFSVKTMVEGYDALYRRLAPGQPLSRVAAAS